MGDMTNTEPATNTRVVTTEPLGYRRPGDRADYTAPAGTQGVVAPPDRDDPPKTFVVIVDEPGGPHDMARIPWVMKRQVEVA